jgi:hypothetical protein
MANSFGHSDRRRLKTKEAKLPMGITARTWMGRLSGLSRRLET